MAVANAKCIEQTASWTRIAIATLVLTAIILNQLVAVDAAANVSREEYFKLKSQLKSLNKPALISIKTANGVIFDCVDIHKQPAFDHPSLKDHKIQMWPTSFPKKVGSNKTRTGDDEMGVQVKVGLPGGGCPQGTVPIRRVRMQDLIRSRSPSTFGRKAATKDNLRTAHEYATVGTPSGQYYGSQVNLNVWRPSLQNAKQFSLGQLWVYSGQTGTFNTVEAGWTHVIDPSGIFSCENETLETRWPGSVEVDPDLFGNNFPHLFVYWTADDYQSTGCYNALCPGFVQVSRQIAPGGVIQPVSSYNGQQETISLQIFKDVKTGNWWLTYGDNNERAVGYWPKSLFNLLRDRASSVRWGGEVYTGGGPRQPQMGSGHFPNEGFRKAAFIRMIMVVDEDNSQRDAPTGATPVVTAPKCYNLDGPDQFGGSGWRRFFYFGGPGC